MKSANSTIRGFDGIRAAAVTAVILQHLHMHNTLKEKGWLSEGVASSLSGWAGVQAFFVLSGFLITHLLIVEQHRNGEVSLRDFYIRRSLRIVPLYLLVVTALLVMQIMFGYVGDERGFVHAYTYTYNFVPAENYSTALGHTWSLAVEEHFYLVWPFLLASAAARWKPLMVGLLIFVPAAMILHAMALRVPELEEGFFLERWSFFAGINIALGCIGALVVNEDRPLRLVAGLTRSYAGAACGCALWFVGAMPVEVPYPFSNYLRGVGFVILVAWIYENQDSLLVRFLELRPIRYVGAISYGLYMYQGFYLGTGPDRGDDQVWPPDQGLGLILLIVTAPISYHLFERPILRFKRRFNRVAIGG